MFSHLLISIIYSITQSCKEVYDYQAFNTSTLLDMHINYSCVTKLTTALLPEGFVIAHGRTEEWKEGTNNL